MSLPSGTVTFLFTDIEGSTKLWDAHPEAMRDALARHDALAAAVIEQHAGALIKSRGEGDSLFAVFARPSDALAAACALQQALFAEPWPPATPLRVRMALHTGAAEMREGDYYGPVVNRCARLRAVAHGGQVLLSGTTADQVRDSLPAGVSARDLGEQRLRDLQQPERVFQILHPALPAEFAPLRSLEAFRHNLPVQWTSFVGREQEIAEVRRLLGSTHLLTLTGSGGCGKTRLALQVAAEMVEEYADGVWLVELAPLTDPALVPWTVASTLGVREETGRQAAATLTDALRSKSLVLVLDNCEHLLSACAQLAETLLRACPRLRILASSREGLNIRGETPYRLRSLSLPDPEHLPALEGLTQYEAVQLFVDRAATVAPSFTLTLANAPAVAQICHRLDGVPLAIELAVARVKALPVETLNERLHDMFRLLTGGSRTALPRQQTLRALIDWSYELLSEAERAMLRRLSVFAGGWTLEAAEAVCSDGEMAGWQDGGVAPETAETISPPHHLTISPPDVLDLLASLVEKSLVIYEEPEVGARYRLLETVRQYSRDRLLESGEAAAMRERHLDWHVALAERAEPELKGRDQVHWLERLEVEQDNLRLALGWALERQGAPENAAGSERRVPADAGLRLAGGLGHYWYIRGHCSEGWEALERALAGAAAAPAGVRAKALQGAGYLLARLGKSPRGRELLEESLALWRSLDDRPGIAEALNCLWLVRFQQGDHPAARTVSEESLAISRAIGDRWNTAHALSNLATTVLAQGDHATARPLWEESLAIQRELGDKRGMAWSLGGLGNVARRQGNGEAARRLYEESLLLHRQIGQVSGIVNVVGTLTQLAREQGDEAMARRLSEEVLAISRKTGDKGTIASMFTNVGWAAFRAGGVSSAREYFEEALALRREVGNTLAIRNALRGVGAVAIAAGEYASARAPLEECLRLDEECGRPNSIAWTFWRLGDAARGAGDYERARAYYQEALAVARAVEWEVIIAESLANLGVVALKQGEPGAALPLLRESLTLWQRMGVPGMIRSCLECLAHVAGAQGQPGRAARLFGAAAAAGELPRSRLDHSFQLVPLDPAEHEAAAAAARAALGEIKFAAVWAEGRSMTLEHAVAYALKQPGVDTPTQ